MALAEQLVPSAVQILRKVQVAGEVAANEPGHLTVAVADREDDAVAEGVDERAAATADELEQLAAFRNKVVPLLPGTLG
jgi:hypothetical protein